MSESPFFVISPSAGVDCKLRASAAVENGGPRRARMCSYKDETINFRPRWTQASGFLCGVSCSPLKFNASRALIRGSAEFRSGSLGGRFLRRLQDLSSLAEIRANRTANSKRQLLPFIRAEDVLGTSPKEISRASGELSSKPASSNALVAACRKLYLMDVPATEFNRWLIPIAAICFHACIGSVYAWSVFNKVIEAEVPLWPRGAAAYTFSIALSCLGLSTAFGGPWVERNGPRRSGLLASVFFFVGHLLGALGIRTGQLWLLLCGFGVVGGIGLGIGYITPVSTLIKWFPEKKGLATGMAVVGFGVGGIVGAQVNRFFSATYGSSTALVILGFIYLGVMALTAPLLRLPPPTWLPAGYVPPVKADGTTGPDMTRGEALRTWQFYVLWFMFFANIAANSSIISQVSPMIQDVFAKSPAEAASWVSVFSLSNAMGRFGWAALSDKLGRRNLFLLFFSVQMLVYAAIPSIGLAGKFTLFTLALFVTYSMYGGGLSIMPALLADTFGSKSVGAIHGAILTAWSVAGLAGPVTITAIRSHRLKTLAPTASRALLYSTTMYIIVGLLACGLLATTLLKPLRSSHSKKSA